MRRRGYYQATATDQPPTISQDGTQADLLLRSFAGPLVKVQYDGDTLPKDKLAEMVPIEREGSVDEDLLEDSSRRIEEYLRQQGYYKARVTHERLERDGELTVVFHIQQDRLYRVAPGGRGDLRKPIGVDRRAEAVQQADSRAIPSSRPGSIRWQAPSSRCICGAASPP